MLHFAPGRPVHANTISSSIVASSHAAIAVRKLFGFIIVYTVEWTEAVGWTKLPKLAYTPFFNQQDP